MKVDLLAAGGQRITPNSMNWGGTNEEMHISCSFRPIPTDLTSPEVVAVTFTRSGTRTGTP